MTAADYEKDLEANLNDLLDRMKSGRYFAPPVRRHYIPKADGTKRPLGIPTFEDKVAQRAILMLLEPIYEADFLPCSYGFRPGRSAHDALNALRAGIIEQRQRWVIDADLKSYFDSIPHTHLRSFLDLRIKESLDSADCLKLFRSSPRSPKALNSNDNLLSSDRCRFLPQGLP